MFYLGIDQHRKQLTVNLRNEAGDVVLRRQVGTDWRKAREFFVQLAAQTAGDGGYVTIVEVCGFNDWLLKLLAGEPSCRRTLLVQAEQRAPHKTDRRDANRLCELLWTNRERLLAGKKVQQLRVIAPPSETDAQARQLTALWRRATRQRTRTINAIHHLLLKHNIQQTCPTKRLKTKAARAWLTQLELPVTDRLEMDLLLDQWVLWDRQCEQLDQQVKLQQRQHAGALLLASAPGCAAFSSLALACRVGDIRRFAGPQSLANYWGLTPGCRNSGEARQRLGSITKQGSAIARFVLGQLVLHVLRRDARMRHWYKQIKNRRGSKIARVAVMRRLTTIFWHMLRHDQPYQLREPCQRPAKDDPRRACVTPPPPRETSAPARQKGAAPPTFALASASGSG
jgi:transposase